MSQWLPFRLTDTVVLDGSGNGSITFGPTVGEWLIEQVAVTVSSNNNEPTFSAYINNIYVGGSYSGSRTNDTSFNQRVQAQEKFSGAWVGGDAGATGTITLIGRKLT